MKHFLSYALFLLLLTGSLSACNSQEAPKPEEVSPMETEEILHEDMPHDAMDAETAPEASAEVQTLRSENQYQSPGGLDDMKVTLTLDNEGTILTAAVATEAKNDGSRYYLETFNKALSPVVVGKKLKDLDALSTLGGASLSTKAFNKALTDLQSQAK